MNFYALKATSVYLKHGSAMVPMIAVTDQMKSTVVSQNWIHVNQRISANCLSKKNLIPSEDVGLHKK